MRSSSKVLWGEGLFLRPQHFQQQDRYHELRLQTAMDALHPYAWGIQSLTVDKESLQNNVLRVLEICAVFPDGEQYNAPDNGPLPRDVDLSDIDLTGNEVTYSIALPSLSAAGPNFAPLGQTDGQSRYVQVNAETADAFTEATAADLSYLKPTPRLLRDTASRDGMVHFPVVKLQRIATGGFEIDARFVPPTLSIRGAPILFLQLRRLLDALQAKVSALQGHHREPSKNIVEFRSSDISSFWLLHTASTAYATLTHYLHHPSLHPERLFEQLLGVAGSLMTFSKSYALTDLPVYQHRDPGPAFASLHSMIRELLDTVISAKYFSIVLNEVKPSYHQGALESGKIDGKTSFYLAINADIPVAELIDVVPLRVKIGAPDDVEKFVLSAMPGIRLTHSPQLPAALPVRPDVSYFVVDNKGPLFERMLQAQTISVYVPSGIRDLQLNLYAVTS